MDMRIAVDVMLSLVIVLSGWFVREVWTKINVQKEELFLLREELPKAYVLKSDMENALNRIDIKLDKIFDKLDGKADKH